MKQQLNAEIKNVPYNKEVQATYFKVLKYAKQQLATIEYEELRFTLERSEEPVIGSIIHEIVSPVLYLRLELHTDKLMRIHFGIEQVHLIGKVSDITTKFLRTLYKLTAKEVTTVNIEASVATDWFINSCSAMYEHIEERLKYHTFKQIPYKVSAQKRKQMLSVA